MPKQEKELIRKRPIFLKDFAPATYDQWRAAADALLKGASIEKTLPTETYEDIQLKPLYCQEDLEDLPHLDNRPGFATYGRGIRASGYLSKSWEVAQEIPLSTPQEFNVALRHDLKNGQTAINLVLDQLSSYGLDSDEGNAIQVGYGGSAISTLEDLELALKEVNLTDIPIFIETGISGMVMGAFLAAHCQKLNISTKSLQGAVAADPLGVLAKDGALPYSINDCYADMAKLTTWARKACPNLQTISVDANRYHNAGASAVQELGCAIAAGVEYVRALLSQKLTIDDIARRMRFSFALGSNFFMEIAKLRAARMLWSQVVKAFDGDEESQKMTIHARTSRWNKTIYDPYVNMLRVTTEAFSGILGGCNSLHVDPFDVALRPPGEFGRRIARNTQIILKEELHLDRLVDPAGGSCYVENLTKELAERAWRLFQQIEAKGGMLQALIDGFPQEQIAETAKKRTENIASRHDKFVGANVYPNLSEKPLQNQQVDSQSIQRERTRYLEKVKASRDNETLGIALENLRMSMEASATQIMDLLVEAADAKATIGELDKAIHKRKSEIKVTPLNIHRGPELFEELRHGMEIYAATNKTVPKVFLANMGPVSQHKACADFSVGFFQVAGFEILNNSGFANTDDASRAAIKSGAEIVVMCSTDDTYQQIVPELTTVIKKTKPGTIMVVAGYSKTYVEAFKQAGVDEFIHRRANAYEILKRIMKKLGVIA